MKPRVLLTMTFIVVIFGGDACKKRLTFTSGANTSAVTLVNAVINTTPLIASFTQTDSVATFFYTASQIGYGSAGEYAVDAGQVPLWVYKIGDTSSAFFRGNLNLISGEIYSLFLSGIDNGQGGVDTLLVIDRPPYHTSTDSSVGIRFVNLVPGSSSISVNLQGNASGSENIGLAYRGITSFKNYLANNSIYSYEFEFRDSASGTLFATFDYSISPFQNITIALIGSEDSTLFTPVSAIQINNF